MKNCKFYLWEVNVNHYEVHKDGWAPTRDEAIREANHYASQYSQDGAVDVSVAHGKSLVHHVTITLVGRG